MKLEYKLTFGCLVVFQDGADDSSSSTHGGIQHMHVFCFFIHLFGESKSDFQSSRLVIQTIGARYQLTVRFGAREPRFQVKLLRGGVIEFPRNNVDNSRRKEHK